MQPTPPTRDAPPHMPEVAQPWTHSSGPVGTTPLLVCPQSRREGCSPHSLPGGPWSESGIPHQRRTSHAENVFFIVENPGSATHTGWNDAALYGEFYRGLAEHIKDQLLSLDHPQTFQQLKADPLKCEIHHWERQGENAAPSGQKRQSASSSAPAKLGNNLTASSNAPTTSRTNPGIGADGKLTQEEWEHR